MNTLVNGCSNRPPRTFPWWRWFAVRFEWGRRLGNKKCPYLIRWLACFGPISLRLHHWISSDDLRYFHDHPWWFLTIVLKGGYTDVSPIGEQRMSRGSFALRPPYHRHSVRVDSEGCWTFMITGPEMRYWGFWVGKKWKKANKYFLEHGHHPCS